VFSNTWSAHGEKNQTGFAILVGGATLVWVRCLHIGIALRTIEAEYSAFSTALHDLLPTRNLL